ncbi:MAG: PDZ domain-containing protein [Armatimonadetes bacterium]|nr:PDZ domain-containing protein [Armatimonadota bacterium]
MRRFAWILVGLTAAAAFAPAQPLDKDAKQAILDAIGRHVKVRAYASGVDFAKWDDLVAEHREDFSEVETQEELAVAVNRAFDEFGLSHLRLLTPYASRVQRTGQGVGIGIRARADEGGVRIVFVLPDSPADKAGLKAGDLITHKDGEPVLSPERLRGDKGTQVTLSLERQDGSKIELTITRRAFSTLVPDEMKWLDDKTVMIRVHSFARGYDRKQIDELFSDAVKADRMILDLRANSGGQTLNLFHLAGKVVAPGTPMGKFIMRNHADDFLKEHPEGGDDPVDVAAEFGFPIFATGGSNAQTFGGDLVVLISGGSASASEIFAAMIQDQERGKLVGVQTAGAVLASTFMPLPEKFSLQLPLMEYVTHGGRRLEGEGVKPDVLIERTLIANDASAIKAALEVLDGGKKPAGAVGNPPPRAA